MNDGLEDVIETVIAEARNGNMLAARLILERLVPIRKGKPVQFQLPPCTDAQGLGEAVRRVQDLVILEDLAQDAVGRLARHHIAPLAFSIKACCGMTSALPPLRRSGPT